MKPGRVPRPAPRLPRPGVRRLALGALGAAVVLGACSSGTEVVASDPSLGPSTTSTGDPGPTTTVSVGDEATLPADRVVWQVDTGGGLTSLAFAVNDVPEVTIYGDGRIFVPDPADPDETSTGPIPKPVGLTLGSVAPSELRAFLADAEATGLVDEAVDYGMPQITDLPGTSVRLHGAGAPGTVSVYALGVELGVDLDGGGDGLGLERSQLDHRIALEDLVERSRGLGGAAEPWVPDRVQVVDLATDEATFEATAEWPGPPFIEVFGTVKPGATIDGPRCAELDGDDAASVFEAALEAGRPFVDDRGAELEVVVRALLPGEEACENL